MTYIWEVLLKADELSFARDKIRFTQTKTPTPYMEVAYEELNRSYLDDAPVEINAYYRFGAIFEHIIRDLDDYPEFRDGIYDILMHYIAEINTREGLCKNEYHGLFLQEDVTAGSFGEGFRDVLDTFPKPLVRFIIENMVRLYELGPSIALLGTVIKQIYPRSIMYLDATQSRELLIYIGKKETPKLRRQADFLTSMFVPFDFTLHIFWDAHFGIFGVDESLGLDDFVIY